MILRQVLQFLNNIDVGTSGLPSSSKPTICLQHSSSVWRSRPSKRIKLKVAYRKSSCSYEEQCIWCGLTVCVVEVKLCAMETTSKMESFCSMRGIKLVSLRPPTWPLAKLLSLNKTFMDTINHKYSNSHSFLSSKGVRTPYFFNSHNFDSKKCRALHC